jgi:hypothetical protein
MINAPTAPDAMATAQAIDPRWQQRQFHGVRSTAMELFAVGKKTSFAEKSRQFLRVQHLLRFPPAKQAPIDA